MLHNFLDASDESISCSHSQDTIEYQMNDDMLNVAVKTSSFYTTATTTMITEVCCALCLLYH